MGFSLWEEGVQSVTQAWTIRLLVRTTFALAVPIVGLAEVGAGPPLNAMAASLLRMDSHPSQRGARLISLLDPAAARQQHVDVEFLQSRQFFRRHL